MLSQKEINKLMEQVLELPKLYDVRQELRIIKDGLSLEEAQEYYNSLTEEERYTHTITSSYPENYCEDLNITMSKAKQLADRSRHTFVLSIEDGTWRAAYGDYGGCTEYRGGNPAYVSCIAILKFMGKL